MVVSMRSLAVFRRGLATHVSQQSMARGFVLPDIWLKRGDEVPGLFSERGAELAWFEYQRHLLNEINRLTPKTPELPSSGELAQLVEAALPLSDRPEVRKLAALASQAYTNEFFFTALRPSAVQSKKTNFSELKDSDLDESELANKLPADLADETSTRYSSGELSLTHNVQSSFGNAQQLANLLVDRGSAIFGNGAVWLVFQKHRLAVVNTYAWGTPLTSEAPAQSAFAPLLGDDHTTTPVLCLNAPLNVYLHDYGVRGKRRFLANAVECINWDVVGKRIEPMHF